MFSYRPRSFLTLVLAGFACVALPLIVAIVTAFLQLNQLVAQSQQAVSRAVQVTADGRLLVEQLTEMERNVRQYQVLNDESLWQAYIATHQKYQLTAHRLLLLPLDGYQAKQLNILMDKEQELFDVLQTNPTESLASKKAILEFAALNEIGASILRKSHNLIDRETKRTQETAYKAQRVLMWQALALVAGAIIFALFFIRHISRPIKQLDQAIRQLGNGDFAAASTVTGPKDLEYLGQRLNWLRCRLIELEEEKRKFLQLVSHELKTPLAAIREGTDLLAEKAVGELNDQQHEITHILQQKSKHLQSLIEDLLNFSMTQERRDFLEMKPISLYRLVQDVIVDHKPLIMSKHIRLALDDNDLFMFGDYEKLRVVIDNLLSNAVKYSPQGGNIRISIRKDQQHAVLDMIDSGPGIDHEDKQSVFEPFYQGPIASDSPVKGSGLGLSIARDYVVAHHGYISILDDARPGAHFRVTLPIHSKDVV